ncbi:hypothetical protein AB6A40_010533 [Gnathostoma spinigerum]|uniref:Uncharacterized protein n=1 Tax=Gnathostoma spinigerum TaxID=75299 RepID=A0ABD6F1R3_9BILA
MGAIAVFTVLTLTSIWFSSADDTVKVTDKVFFDIEIGGVKMPHWSWKYLGGPNVEATQETVGLLSSLLTGCLVLERI